MPDLFDRSVQAIGVACARCGKALEIADSAVDAFGSIDSVLCLECLLNHSDPDDTQPSVSSAERDLLIENVVTEFSLHLRTVLQQQVGQTLTWDYDYPMRLWDDPRDALAAAHAPSIWHTIRAVPSHSTE